MVASTGTGLGVFVTERSAPSATGTLAVALLLALFGSTGVVSATDAVSVIVVPEATPELTVTTKVKVALVFAANVVLALFVHSRVTVLQVHPAGPVKEKTVVFAGKVSVNVMDPAVVDPAVAGPRFWTTCVKVILLPAVTGVGLGVFERLRSACPLEATAMLTVAELLFRFVSRDAVPTVAVSVMIVPAPVPPFTV